MQEISSSHYDTSLIRLSLVIPVLNGENTIFETIRSVVKIHEPNLEIIISDNRSEDNTLSIIKAFNDDRIKIVSPKKRLTAAEHWTFASKFASGKYFKLVCADDLINSKSVFKQMQILDDNDSVVLVATKRSIVNTSGKTLIKKHGLKNIKGFQIGVDALSKSIKTGTNQFGEPVCVMFRNKILQQNLPWNENYPYVIDLDMYSKVLKYGNHFGVDEIGASFRVSNTSWSTKLQSVQSQNFLGWAKNANEEFSLNFTFLDFLSLRFKTLFYAIMRILVTKFLSLKK